MRNPDVLCLQETKVPDNRFPIDELRNAGYFCVFRGQPTYNGVAILSRVPPSDPLPAIPGWDDPECRYLSATVGDLRVINIYVPNGQDIGTEKFRYKILWLSHLLSHLAEEKNRFRKLILAGDFNIAPEDRDVYDPPSFSGQLFCSGEERSFLRKLKDLGLEDGFRALNPAGGQYSWWDYRAGMFRRNMGLRIDLILASTELLSALSATGIDRDIRKNERPSDHAPVWIEGTFSSCQQSLRDPGRKTHFRTVPPMSFPMEAPFDPGRVNGS